MKCFCDCRRIYRGDYAGEDKALSGVCGQSLVLGRHRAYIQNILDNRKRTITLTITLKG